MSRFRYPRWPHDAILLVQIFFALRNSPFFDLWTLRVYFAPPVLLILSMPSNKSDLTYIRCCWSVSVNGSLYVQLEDPKSPRPRLSKLGSISGAKYSSTCRLPDGSKATVFIIEVAYSAATDEESQDVDAPLSILTKLVIVCEDNFCDFPVTNWRTHPSLLAAANAARGSTNKEKWFKDFVSTHCDSSSAGNESFTGTEEPPSSQSTGGSGTPVRVAPQPATGHTPGAPRPSVFEAPTGAPSPAPRKPIGVPLVHHRQNENSTAGTLVFDPFFFAAENTTCQSLWKSVMQPPFSRHNKQIYINGKMPLNFHTPNNSTFMPTAKIYMFFSIYINFFSLTLISHVIRTQMKCVHSLDLTSVRTRKKMISTTMTKTHCGVVVACGRHKHSRHAEGIPAQPEVCHHRPDVP